MRKNLFLIITLVLSCLSAVMAQNNDKISYQAVVRNSTNHLVYNTDLNVTVSLANSDGGPSVYTETHAVTSNANGLISLMIGDGVYVSGSWSAVQWSSAYMTATITRSSNGELIATHTMPLSAVPYALMADYADSVNNSVIANYLTANGYLTEEVQVLSISHDTIYLTGGSFVKLPAGFSGDYNALTNKPDLDQYATNAHLNDTLGHYYTNTEINDTLSHYLQTDELCDSIVKCDIIQNMRDSIQINATNIANNTTSITNNTTNITNNTNNITNITNNITNLQNADSVLEARILNDSILSHKLDSVLSARITADSTNLSDNYYNKDDINDTLSHYLMEEVQVLSISNDTIYLTGGSFVKLPAGFSGNYNELTNKPDLGQYATNTHLNDTLSHYYTNTEVNDTLGYYLQTGDLCDSIVKCGVIQNMRDSIQNNATNITNVQTDITNIAGNIISLLNADSILAAQILNDSVLFYKADSILLARITADSANLSNNYYNKTNINDTLSHYYTNTEINDTLSHYYTNTEINDTLSHYYTNTEVNDTLSHYYTNTEINDTLSHYYTNTEINDTLSHYYTNTVINDTLGYYLQAGDLCDSIVKCDVIQNMRDSIHDMFDTIHAMHDSIHINTTNISNNTTNITTITNNITNITTDLHAVDSILNARITKDSMALSNRMDTLLTHVCDSVETCVKGWISDSTRMVVDSLNAYYDTTRMKAAIHDTADALRSIMSAAANDAKITIQKNGVEVDHFTVNQTANQDINILVPTTVAEMTDAANYVTTTKLNDTLDEYAKKDTLDKYTTTSQLDTIISKYGYAQKDTLKNYLTINGLCDSVKKCEVITTMQTNITDVTNNLDSTKTNIRNEINSKVTNLQSADAALSARITADSNKLVNNYYNKIDINDTLDDYAKKDTLKNYLTINGLCDSVKKCEVITTMQTNITDVTNNLDSTKTNIRNEINNKVTNLQNADNALSERITNDSLKLLNNYYDKVKINDTLGAYTTTNQLDTIISKYGYAKSDTLKNYLTINGLCDSVKKCEVVTTLQTNVTANTTAINNLQTKMQSDSLTLANKIRTDSTALAGKMHSDSLTLANKIRTDSTALVNRIVADSTALAGKIKSDSATLAQRMDTVYKHLCDSVMACESIQTMQTNITTNTNKITDNTTAINNLQTKMQSDSLTLANKMRTDSTALVNRIVADSTALAGKMHSDSLTLANKIRTDSTALVNRIVADSTALAGKMHSDSLTLANKMRTDSTALVNRIVADSTALAGKMHSDSLTLANKIRTDSTALVNRIVYDSTKLHDALIDTAQNIRNSIGNGTLTFTYGTNAPVTFTANQKTNTSIEIPAPTAPNNATLTIQKNGADIGTFTADQASDKTINITVPTCDSLNDCDLIKSILSRLDRLERQNDSLARELDKLKPALTVTASQDAVTVCSGSSQPVTYTATFHNCSSSDYTLSWKVNGTDSSNVTIPTFTFNAEAAGDYVVVCVATRSDNSSVTDTVTTHVEVDLNVPSFTVTANNLTVTLSDTMNIATIQWDTDSLPVAMSNDSTKHSYAVADTITITATSSTGCTFTMGLRLQATAPTVTTDSIPTGTVAASTAKAYGTVTSDGGIPETKRGMVYSTSDQNLKLGVNGVDSIIANGTGKGSYSCDLKRLVPCTTYYVRAFAFNDVDTAYGDVMNFTTLPFTCGSTLTDIDGNEYGTLLLGSQCWMQQNLRTTRFADGTEIPVGGLGLANQTGARRYAPDNNLNTYGYLYNWDAAMNGSASSDANPSGVQGVCPDGWHLPSDAEWTQLTTFVASNSANVCDNNPLYIAKSLVSTEDWGSGAWSACSSITTNNTGFSVLPAGTWHVNAALGHIDQGYAVGMAIFRTATVYEENYVQAKEFYTENPYVDATAIDKTNGLSVRCVLTCPTESAYLPTVSVVSLSRTGTTVSMTSNVLSDGGAAVTERGVCWGTTQHPTTSSTHKVATGTGLGAFSVSEDFTPGTTYYIRAYAVNSEGTAYGGEIAFVMPVPYVLPTVNTGSKFLALMEGFEGSTLPSSWTTIDNDGDGDNWFQDSWMAHTGEGHVISASHNSSYEPLSTLDNYLITPDIKLPSSISPVLSFWYSSLYGNPEHFEVKVGSVGASTVGDFSTQVFEVTDDDDDYTQAIVNLSSYAGQTIRLAFVHTPPTDVTFLLIDDIVVGEAGADATAVVSDITATTASCSGYVADDGGATVTARGVCWSTSQNPTISNSHTTDGTGTGSFTSNITGLSGNTTYYVRAYATNSVGTTYGNQVSFTTTVALPVVTTNAVSNITLDNSTINATCGGNVTEEGASAVTARGVCWSTSSNPTTAGSHTTDGNGLGSFTSTITGLISGTTYYVRAYATSSAGTVYGNQVSFAIPVVDAKSCTSAPVVSDHEGNMYATVQIGTQCWMRENLRTTTSPKTGTYLVNTANKPTPGSTPGPTGASSYGSKVAHWYNNDPTTNAPKGYGLLYNWCAAMDTANSTNYMEVPTPSNVNGNNNYFSVTVSGNHRGICPAGWHLPSYTEWNTLKTAASNTQYNLQVDGSAWSANATNSTGFTALPAGIFQSSYGTFQSQDRTAFWSCTNGTDRAQQLYMQSGQIQLSLNDKNRGNSVRCIKD